jgi:hypothetical protein
MTSSNKNKILFNLITCNRFHYFKNCLESVLHTFDLDRIKILVCDNKTIEPGFSEYLSDVSSKHGIEVKVYDDRVSNELHRAMNFAVEYARSNGFQIINFVQEDFQYVWKNDKLVDDVFGIFSSHDNLVQINPNMGWRYKLKKLGKVSNINIDGTNYAILLKKTPCDNGFTRVAAYDKTGLYPSDVLTWGIGPDRYKKKIHGEIWFGTVCRKNGFKRCLTYLPNAGMIYDCSFVRGDIRCGKYFPAPNEFYFKMLNDDEISRIRKRNSKREFTFIEDACNPDGWTPRTNMKHSDDDIVVKIG